MIVVGLGLGMVMQVLVLAAQNSVEHRLLGVATSASTLFRQIGGSIGVALFGAIFANRLAQELAQRLPGRRAHLHRRDAGDHPPSPGRGPRPIRVGLRRRAEPVFLAAASSRWLPSRSPGCSATCRCGILLRRRAGRRPSDEHHRAPPPPRRATQSRAHPGRARWCLPFAKRAVEVTLDDVAERAGVGAGTVYRRYPNKDALLDDSFEARVA